MYNALISVVSKFSVIFSNVNISFNTPQLLYI